MDTKLTSVRHANGSDWWIYDSLIAQQGSIFSKVAVHPSGFQGPDYIELSDWVEGGYQFGNMFFNQNGDRLIVIEETGFEVYNFDRCSGELEQIGIIEDIPVTRLWYGALSASGQKLYIIYHNFIEGQLKTTQASFSMILAFT